MGEFRAAEPVEDGVGDQLVDRLDHAVRLTATDNTPRLVPATQT